MAFSLVLKRRIFVGAIQRLICSTLRPNTSVLLLSRVPAILGTKIAMVAPSDSILIRSGSIDSSAKPSKKSLNFDSPMSDSVVPTNFLSQLGKDL